MVKFHKLVLAVLLGICLTSFFGYLSIHLVYYAILPSAPEEKTGRTYEMLVNHGVRYGSKGEFRVFNVADNSIFFAAIISLIGVVVGLKWGILRLRGSGQT
jgi:hypothetical protein